MLVATTSMAARLERAEADTAAAFGRQSAKAGRGVFIEPIGGTHAIYGGPGQPFNKVAGLGFAPLDEGALARLEARYDAAGGEIRVEQSSLADPAVAALLTGRGYALIGYENVLGLALTGDVVSAFARECAAARERGIDVAVAAHETSDWIRTVAEGFLHPDSFDGPQPTEMVARDGVERIFAEFSGAPGCILYLARRYGEL